MDMQLLRRRKLGYGSCVGIANYMSEMGTPNVSVLRNDRGIAGAKVVVRWGCTSNTGHDSIIVNSARGIHNVCDKVGFRRVLQDAGVSVPTTFFSKEEVTNFLSSQEGQGVSLIGRPAQHSQGRIAVVCDTPQDVYRDTTSRYWSVIIPKEKEFRVYCFFGKVIAVAEKIPTDPTALLWNAAQGGSSFYNVRWDGWPINVVKEALKVHRLSGCDFEGVDVMEYQGVPYILESNSAPSLTTEYRKQCFAKGFNWVYNHVNGHGTKPPHFEEEAGSNYRAFIHPSIMG